MYCSDLCREEGKTIRYIRAVMRDGRMDDPEVREAVEIRMAILLGGGYPERQRRLAAAGRAAVFERDSRRCQLCGEPVTEIDHIDGGLTEGLNNLDNLRALCGGCHRGKTKSAFRRPNEEESRRALAYQERTDAPVPLRPSDDEQNWPKLWPRLLAERRRVVLVRR